MITNINIKNSEYTFKYPIEFILDNPDFTETKTFKYSERDSDINIFNGDTYIRNENGWINSTPNKTFTINNYNDAKLRIYFPLHSIETYENCVLYMLDINTWINDKKIYLGNYLLNRNEALAIDTPLKYENELYYEYLEFNIINPDDMIYNDEWLEFRKNICGASTVNNIGSILNITLHPVTENPMGYNKQSDDYIIYDKYTGGQNSINTSKKKQNYLKLNIEPDYSKDSISIKCTTIFNKSFKNINEYIKNTYGNEPESYKYQLIVKSYIKPEKEIKLIMDSKIKDKYEDEDYDFSIILKPVDSKIFTAEEFNTTYNFSKYNIVQSLDLFKYDKKDSNIIDTETSWKNWKEGLFFNASLEIKTKPDIEGFINTINIFSNEIPFTQELYKLFASNSITPTVTILDDGNEEIKYIYKINLDNMNIKTVNVVNKIENKIIQVDKPEDSKSNIITPVFFRTRDTSNIQIYPAVTENICIDLGPYKNKVNSFIMQIEGVNFNEIGSTPQGVIFKIIGNMLPGKESTGTYFILNEQYEMITSGKYTYIK